MTDANFLILGCVLMCGGLSISKLQIALNHLTNEKNLADFYTGLIAAIVGAGLTLYGWIGILG